MLLKFHNDNISIAFSKDDLDLITKVFYMKIIKAEKVLEKRNSTNPDYLIKILKKYKSLYRKLNKMGFRYEKSQSKTLKDRVKELEDTVYKNQAG